MWSRQQPPESCRSGGIRRPVTIGWSSLPRWALPTPALRILKLRAHSLLQSTPPPSPPPSQASPPALPVLTSTNFHLADLDFPLPSSLDILSSVQLLCLQFRDDFSPTKIWDETAGLTGQEEIEGIWLRRATRDQRKGLRWTEVAAASTSSNDSRRSSAATRGVESRYGSVDHPPPTPDSPTLSLHHSDTTTELRLSSHLRRRSSRSRSPPPRKARPDIDRPSHAALSSSRRHSSEEVDGTSAAHGSRLPDVQRNMSPSAALALPEGDVGHVPRSLSDSFHTIKITVTIRRVARDEVLGWLPKRLSPGLIDVKGAQGWLAWKSESEAAVSLALRVRGCRSVTDDSIRLGRPRAPQRAVGRACRASRYLGQRSRLAVALDRRPVSSLRAF